jgi:FkbM family methyltransferase
MTIKTPPFEIHRNQYGRYAIPVSSRHRPCARKIIAGKVYEPHTIRFIKQHCADGDVIHAGAYFGDFLPALSKAIQPGAIVWAFEPNTENHACATRTIELNNLENVRLKRAALGDFPHPAVDLRIADRSGKPLGGGSHLVADGFQWGCEKAPMVTIDEEISTSRNISILHLDIESKTVDALNGALKTIARCHPIVILEHCRKDIFQWWFNKNLPTHRYRPIIMFNENIVFKPHGNPS